MVLIHQNNSTLSQRKVATGKYRLQILSSESLTGSALPTPLQAILITKATNTLSFDTSSLSEGYMLAGFNLIASDGGGILDSSVSQGSSSVTLNDTVDDLGTIFIEFEILKMDPTYA